jgi:hypothetical protein
MAVVVLGGLGEQAGEFHLAGMGLAVLAFPGPAFGLGCHHRHAGAVDGDIELVRQRRGRGQGGQRAGGDRGGPGPGDLSSRSAVRLSGAAQPLAGQRDPGQLTDQPGRSGERHRRGGAGGHLAQPRRHRLAGHAQLTVPRCQAVAAAGAVVPGPAQRDRAEYRADGLVPVGGKLRLVPGRADGPRAPEPRIGGQQRLQQATAKLGQPGADGQFRRLQPPAGGQRRRHRGGQLAYLGGRLRGERVAEPFFCPSGAGAWPPAAGGAGRASQIASLTSTICSLSAANS